MPKTLFGKTEPFAKGDEFTLGGKIFATVTKDGFSIMPETREVRRSFTLT
ncbi:hypothetical protein [Streptomyces sp. NPDC058612]